MFCPNCHREVPNQSAVCPFCGLNLVIGNVPPSDYGVQVPSEMTPTSGIPQGYAPNMQEAIPLRNRPISPMESLRMSTGGYPPQPPSYPAQLYSQVSPQPISPQVNPAYYQQGTPSVQPAYPPSYPPTPMAPPMQYQQNPMPIPPMPQASYPQFPQQVVPLVQPSPAQSGNLQTTVPVSPNPPQEQHANTPLPPPLVVPMDESATRESSPQISDTSATSIPCVTPSSSNSSDEETSQETQKSSTPDDGIMSPPPVTMTSWSKRSDEGPITCPHCWGRCSMDSILFISQHPSLVGDPLLGEDAQKRFLPQFYTTRGTALDPSGMECTDMACPYCHLRIPNSVIDMPCSIFSLVGAPSSGKSYLLTSMVWELRKSLPENFYFNFTDADPSFNMVLNNYENLLFMNLNASRLVSLPKTELRGTDFSNQIIIDGAPIELPRPFIFSMVPTPTHPNFGRDGHSLERSIILYDNAGEHFETGRDSASSLATSHLVHSDGILFLFDPFKDARMRSKCSQNDPQFSKASSIGNQNGIFTEMVSRIQRYGNLRANEKYQRPLIVVVPKFDAWGDNFPFKPGEIKFILMDPETGISYLDLSSICIISFCMRQYLLKVSPDIVRMAENFANKVYFFPVSALGKTPELDDDTGSIGIKPEHLQPQWADIPFLLMLYLNGLLQAAVVERDDIPTLSDCRLINGRVIFHFPGSTERIELPQLYAGKCVYNEHDKTIYQLPDLHTPAASKSNMHNESLVTEQVPLANSRQNSDIDVNFWKN